MCRQTYLWWLLLVFSVFANVGKDRINNATWGITIQAFSDTLLHNLCASDSFEAAVDLTRISVFALVLCMGSCKKTLEFWYQTTSNKLICQKPFSKNRYSPDYMPKLKCMIKPLTPVPKQLQQQKRLLLPNLLPGTWSFSLEAHAKPASSCCLEEYPHWNLLTCTRIVSLSIGCALRNPLKKGGRGGEILFIDCNRG